jgi:ubiquinone/menaquinone biosynthesis C-methylase UbiE
MGRQYSYKEEHEYYSRAWPREARPYSHLAPYLSQWLDARTAFEGKRVLDIGAGECLYTRLIADRFAPNHIVATDLFRERLAPAFEANSNRDLDFTCADALHLPFRDGVFDVVFGSLVLCQIPGLDALVQEISRVLKRGGTYLGFEPNPYNVKHFLRHLQHRHSRNVYLMRPHHLRAFRESGFEVQITWFYRRLPRMRSPLVASQMGIVATRKG